MKFRGKTAEGLLNYIVRKIEADKEGYDQHHWKNETGCRTTCCVAGEVLCEMRPKEFASAEDSFYDFKPTAQRILGLNSDQAAILFDGDAAGSRRTYDEASREWHDDIEGHARRGIKHIKAFIRTHRAQLRAKRVR